MPDKQSTDENILVRTAKKIGVAAGRLASAAGVEPGDSQSSVAPGTAPQIGKADAGGKLQKKNKTRLPRRLKKAQLKAANSVKVA